MKKKFTIFPSLFFLGLLFVAFACKSDEPEISDWIDPEFAKVLAERGYIKNAENVTIKEVESLVEIDVSGNNYSDRGSLRSMRGIEYFSNLEELKCHSNLIEDLNVSSLKKLRVLDCSDNRITTLYVKANKNLEILKVDTNRITKLDLSGLNKITFIDCSNNQFSELIVKDQVNLTDLTCSYLNLTNLDVSNNTKLRDLRCHANKLEGINIANCRDLQVLDCRWNPGKNGVFTVIAWFDANNIPIWIVYEEDHADVKLKIVKQ